MADWNAEANAIFLRAMEVQDVQQRHQLLDEACAGKPYLRAQVDALLHALDNAGSFLQQPAIAANEGGAIPIPSESTEDAPPPIVQPGSWVGRYKLLQVLGEGGMGSVYMAEQHEPVRRRVALKIIRPGMDSRQVIARFEAERQALAMMDHHNIAKVLDAGTTETERPYFVMELVHGVPLTEYCDKNRLTLHERLELFVPVCRAIQHAHQKGIVHRDIKPSNVLVTLYDGLPVPKVIDFGVAKALDQPLTEKTMFTQYGALVGTLEYMSPEQAEMSGLGVDTRSDVYSLGVLLYELLTGATPLDRQRLREAGLAEILRWIREEEPPVPSTRLSTTATLPSVAAQRRAEPSKLSRLVRGELDWIVMKCLEKDRTRRYETASALARDLERYLEDEPVEACPPSTAYRLRKFAGKHRTAIGAIAAFILLLIGATAVSSWLAVRATFAERNANEQRQKTFDALQTAERRRQAETAARKDLQLAVHGLYESLGISSDARDRVGEAGLWFTQALRVPIEPAKQAANHVRVRTWNSVVPRPVAVRERSGANMWHLSFHPSLPFLLSSDTHHQWVLWNWRTDQRVEMAPQGQQVRSALWIAEGEQLCVGMDTGMVRVLDFPTMTEAYTITHRGEIRVLAHHPDEQLLAVGGKSARVWDLEKQEFVTPELVVSDADYQVRSIAFSQRGHLVSVGDEAYVGAVFGVPATDETAEPVSKRFLHGAGHIPSDLTRPWPPLFVADDRYVLSADPTRGLLMREAKTGQRLESLMPGVLPAAIATTHGGNRAMFASENIAVSMAFGQGITPAYIVPAGGHRNHITALALRADGQRLLSASADHTAVIWHRSREPRRALRMHHPSRVQAAVFSRDGRFVATAQEGGKLIVWDVFPEAMQAYPPVKIGGDGSLVRLAANARHYLPAGWSAQGQAAMLSTRIYDVATGEPASREFAPGGCILDAALSSDGRHIAIVTNERRRHPHEGKLHYLNVETGEPPWNAKAMPSEPRSVRVHPKGHQLVVCCASGQVLLLAAETGEVEQQWQAWDGTHGASQYVNNGKADFSPDGSLVIASGGYMEGPCVWSTETGELKFVLTQTDKKVCSDVQFSPDGRYMASAGTDANLRVWDVATGKLAAEPILHPGWLTTARFSRDGRWVATGADDQAARVWDWRTGQLVGPPLEHHGMVIDVAFVPKTPWLMTVSLDRTARVWDIASGRALTPPLPLEHRALSLAITPDGHHAVIGTTGDVAITLSLADLHASDPLDVDANQNLYELLSCRKVVDGLGTTMLTPPEWMERWAKYRQPRGVNRSAE